MGISRNSWIIAIILIVMILIAWSTDPRRNKMKSGAMRPPPNPLMQQFAAAPQEQQPNNAGQQASGQQKNRKKTNSRSRRRQGAYDAAGFSDFELLNDRYGRSDPFAPFYDIPEPDETLLDIPAIEPLPPMILESPANMKLTAVSIQDDGTGMAIINGEIVRVGDYVLGFRVHYISQNRVELINELGDKAILRIKQAVPTGYEVTRGEISNIQKVPEKQPQRTVIPTRQQSPLPLPPSNWTNLRPDELPSAPSTRQHKKTKPNISITPDPQQEALDEIRKILSNPENLPLN